MDRQAAAAVQAITEPSVINVKQQLQQQKPLTGTQQQILQSTSRIPPGGQDSLERFMSQLEDVSPTIPDAVTEYFMRKSGLQTSDTRVVRLISLATQKFISDIVVDAASQARLKGQGGRAGRGGAKDGKLTLTTDLLEPVLKEYGIDTLRAPYHH